MTKCDRCGEVNPAEIHTCTPKQPEPVIQARKEGGLIVVDLPLVPTGGGGISKREWVGLTAKDLAEIPPSCYEGAIWADAKLKEKNGG